MAGGRLAGLSEGMAPGHPASPADGDRRGAARSGGADPPRGIPGLAALDADGVERNGPDLHVYLSSDPEGYAADALDLGGLEATDGSFNHEIPAGIDPSRYRSVVIWCEPFSVLFAVAPLAAG